MWVEHSVADCELVCMFVLQVSKLEAELEVQKEMFLNMLKDLSIKLTEETDRRMQLQQEMDKVASLVTQV
jgi:hypothetical protein